LADWMVVCAVICEPVSEAKIPDNREKYREKCKNKRKRAARMSKAQHPWA